MKKKVYKGHKKLILLLVMLVVGLVVGALVIPLRAADQGGEGTTTIQFQGSFVRPDTANVPCNQTTNRGALYFYKVPDGTAGDDILFLCKQKIVDQPTGQSDYVWVQVSN